jgi:hypothetical protein
VQQCVNPFARLGSLTDAAVRCANCPPEPSHRTAVGVDLEAALAEVALSAVLVLRGREERGREETGTERRGGRPLASHRRHPRSCPKPHNRSTWHRPHTQLLLHIPRQPAWPVDPSRLRSPIAQRHVRVHCYRVSRVYSLPPHPHTRDPSPTSMHSTQRPPCCWPPLPSSLWALDFSPALHPAGG